MWVSRSEEDVMDHTGEVYPNCFVIGLAVSAVHGTPRMGPAFGSMLLSGRYGAELIKKKLNKNSETLSPAAAQKGQPARPQARENRRRTLGVR